MHDDLITDMILFNKIYLITVSWDFKVKLWDINRIQNISLLKLFEGHSDKVTGITYLRKILFICIYFLLLNILITIIFFQKANFHLESKKERRR